MTGRPAAACISTPNSWAFKPMHMPMTTELVGVQLRPVKAFQGWRYLAAADAPPDRPRGLAEAQEGLEAMPASMRRELAELGLL